MERLTAFKKGNINRFPFLSLLTAKLVVTYDDPCQPPGYKEDVAAYLAFYLEVYLFKDLEVNLMDDINEYDPDIMPNNYRQWIMDLIFQI